MKIRTVGELREALKDESDDVPVMIAIGNKADVIMGVHRRTVVGFPILILADIDVEVTVEVNQ